MLCPTLSMHGDPSPPGRTPPPPEPHPAAPPASQPCGRGNDAKKHRGDDAKGAASERGKVPCWPSGSSATCGPHPTMLRLLARTSTLLATPNSEPAGSQPPPFTHCSGCSPSACAAGSTDRPRTSLPNSTPALRRQLGWLSEAATLYYMPACMTNTPSVEPTR